MTEQEIISGVLKEFEGLAKHPRPSHHEKTKCIILLPMFRQRRVVKTFL